jgi:Flp pilus assembly protein TadD
MAPEVSGAPDAAFALAPAEIAKLHALVRAQPEAQGSSPRALTIAASSALVIGHVDDALALVRGALALDPKSARAWAVAGDALWQAGKPAEARVAYEEAVALDDKDLATIVNCARAQLATGAVSEARAHLDFVLLQSPSAELVETATALLDATPDASDSEDGETP